MVDARTLRRTCAIAGAALALALAALPPATALARTPTPSITPTITDGPSPTVTGTASPTPTGTVPVPFVVANLSPDPARGGQRVTLDGSGNNPSGTYRWTQAAGDVALQIEDADQAVAHFIAPDVAVITVVSVQLQVSGFNSGPRTFDVTLLPVDWVLCGIGADGSGSAPPGDVLPVSVVLRPYGLAVTTFDHEMGFGPFAPVVDRGGGVPDCQPGPDLSVLSASFAFVPDGCVQTDSCTGVHATLTTRFAIPDYGVAYRCMVALVEEPSPQEEGCYHTLTCVGGTAISSAGRALTVNCPEGSDGHVSADYALRPLSFDFHAVPAAPNVGDTVQVTFAAQGEGGLPHYDLHGADPILHGTVSADVRGPLGGDVSFELQADCPGTAQLSLSVNYETLAGCPGNTYFRFTSQSSPVFPLIVRDPGSFRVTGRVAAQPTGCGGEAQVPVRLDPLGWTVMSGADGEFAFDGVPPGDYTLSVASGCGRFQCWSQQAVRVDTQDVDMTLCPARLAGDACIGDCNLDDMVSVDELIVGVGMLLGNQAFEACPAVDADGDGTIEVNELIRAVGSLLSGCTAEPPEP